MILLAHIVHEQGAASRTDAAQLKQNAKRQTRCGDYLGLRSHGTRHPKRHRQWPAVSTPHHVVGLIVKLIEPDHGQTMRAQGMELVVDCDFSRVMLMGSMSFSCCDQLSNI